VAPDLIASVIAIAIRTGTSVLFATLGGIIAERAGVVTLATEGLMLCGAVLGFAAAFWTGNVWIGFACGMLVGGLLHLIYAFWAVSLRANQMASGLALTIATSGLAIFLGQRLGPDGQSLVGQVGPRLQVTPIPLLSSLPIVGGIFNQDLITYLAYATAIVAWYFLFHTRPGIHLRAVGENPQAAHALGVNVVRLRYLYTVIGGMLIGLGGAHLSLSYTPGWSDSITSGRGWIAIAMVIFSSWRPERAVLGAFLFGGITAIQFRLQAGGIAISSYFLAMLPYVATLVVIAVISRRSSQTRGSVPGALGVPFFRE
jgi:general nucleoside transport system permease protein